MARKTPSLGVILERKINRRRSAAYRRLVLLILMYKCLSDRFVSFIRAKFIKDEWVEGIPPSSAIERWFSRHRTHSMHELGELQQAVKESLGYYIPSFYLWDKMQYLAERRQTTECTVLMRAALPYVSEVTDYKPLRFLDGLRISYGERQMLLCETIELMSGYSLKEYGEALEYLNKETKND